MGLGSASMPPGLMAPWDASPTIPTCAPRWQEFMGICAWLISKGRVDGFYHQLLQNKHSKIEGIVGVVSVQQLGYQLGYQLAHVTVPQPSKGQLESLH